MAKWNQVALEVPEDLIGEYKRYKKKSRGVTLRIAQELLKPYKMQKQIIAVIDSEGFTKQTRELAHDGDYGSILSHYQKLNILKEIVAEVIKSCGGKTTSVWCADNAQGIVPAHDPDVVVQAMRRAQHTLEKRTGGQLKMGVGLHYADEFYMIKGHLYGQNINEVNWFGEELTLGGVVTVSHELIEKMDTEQWIIHDRGKQKVPKSVGRSKKKPLYLYNVDAANSHEPYGDSAGMSYPAPWSEEFHTLLKQAHSKHEFDALVREYAQEKNILYIKRSPKIGPRKEAEFKILEDLENYYDMARILEDMLTGYPGVVEIKTTPELALLAVHSPGVAVDFAEDARELLEAEGVEICMAMESGQVFIHDISGGNHECGRKKEIDGYSVNILSKCAEDTFIKNGIYICENMRSKLNQARLLGQSPHFESYKQCMIDKGDYTLFPWLQVIT